MRTFEDYFDNFMLHAAECTERMLCDLDFVRVRQDFHHLVISSVEVSVFDLIIPERNLMQLIKASKRVVPIISPSGEIATVEDALISLEDAALSRLEEMSSEQVESYPSLADLFHDYKEMMG